MLTSSLSNPARVLTIGGSDSSGSAGIQADLKTFEARGVFGCSAITVVTAQNTQGVQAAHPLPEAFIQQQANAVLEDIGAHALKTGLLGRASVIGLVAELIQSHALKQVVVDPVILDGHNVQFVADDAITAYQTQLFPHATVITPNLDEAMRFTQRSIVNLEEMRQAAQQLHQLGVKVVVIKGGHLVGDDSIIDLVFDGEQFYELVALRLPVENPHGVGCTFASAITAELAKGQSVVVAIQTAHRYLQAALAGSLEWQLGKGRLPVFHGVGRLPTNHAPDEQSSALA